MPEEGFPDREIKLYRELIRVEGDGDFRLGTHLELREDMYGLTVLCFLNDEALDEALEFEEQENAIRDDIQITAHEDTKTVDDNFQNVNASESANDDAPNKANASESRKMQNRSYINKRAKNASTALMIWTFQSMIAFMLLGDVL